MPKIETKHIGGHVVQTKQQERNGVPVGIIAGYIATWDVDRGSSWQLPDKFLPGAFTKAIARHKANGRQARMHYPHGKLIGGFPIDTVKQDDTGLYGEGEVNLKTVDGAEAYSLAQQGVLVDFSIGFESLDDDTKEGVRLIKESEFWHGALVDEPMNPAAAVTDVKAFTVTELEGMTRRDIEKTLIDSGVWSKAAAKVLASGFGIPDASDEIASLLEELQGARQAIR